VSGDCGDEQVEGQIAEDGAEARPAQCFSHGGRSMRAQWFVLCSLIAVIPAVAAAVMYGSRGSANAAANVAAERPQERSQILRDKRNHTSACLHDGALALLEIGERDVEVINGWAVRKCSGNLTFYLASELERSKQETDRYVRSLIKREVAELVKGWAP